MVVAAAVAAVAAVVAEAAVARTQPLERILCSSVRRKVVLSLTIFQSRYECSKAASPRRSVLLGLMEERLDDAIETLLIPLPTTWDQ